MLTSIQSASVAPEVNLRITQARQYGQYAKGDLALKPRADITRSSKQGYQWPHEKDLCPPKVLKNQRVKLLYNGLRLSDMLIVF